MNKTNCKLCKLLKSLNEINQKKITVSRRLLKNNLSNQNFDSTYNKNYQKCVKIIIQYNILLTYINKISNYEKQCEQYFEY